MQTGKRAARQIQHKASRTEARKTASSVVLAPARVCDRGDGSLQLHMPWSSPTPHATSSLPVALTSTSASAGRNYSKRLLCDRGDGVAAAAHVLVAPGHT
jgi:hypothetical protein